MNTFFITFNPHPNDTIKFNDFLNFLIPAVKNNFSEYQLVIEKNNSPDAHFHAIIRDKIRDAEKLQIKLYQELRKSYQIFNHTETGKSKIKRGKFEAPAWKVIKLKDEQVNDRIGYLFKECYNNTRETNMDLEHLLQCFKEYILNEQVKESKDKYKGLEEWKLLSVGNAHTHIQYWIKENIPKDMDIDKLDIRTLMQTDNYSFAKLGKKTEEDIWHELYLRRNKDIFETPVEKAEISSYYDYQEIINKKNLEIEMLESHLEQVQKELHELKST
jgi:hypothetical protein